MCKAPKNEMHVIVHNRTSIQNEKGTSMPSGASMGMIRQGHNRREESTYGLQFTRPGLAFKPGSLIHYAATPVI